MCEEAPGERKEQQLPAGQCPRPGRLLPGQGQVRDAASGGLGLLQTVPRRSTPPAPPVYAPFNDRLASVTGTGCWKPRWTVGLSPASRSRSEVGSGPHCLYLSRLVKSDGPEWLLPCSRALETGFSRSPPPQGPTTGPRGLLQTSVRGHCSSGSPALRESHAGTLRQGQQAGATRRLTVTQVKTLSHCPPRGTFLRAVCPSSLTRGGAVSTVALLCPWS